MAENRTTDDDTETVAFQCYGLAASLEPCVGLLLELAGDSTWLSWDETCKLTEFLRRNVAA